MKSERNCLIIIHREADTVLSIWLRKRCSTPKLFCERGQTFYFPVLNRKTTFRLFSDFFKIGKLQHFDTKSDKQSGNTKIGNRNRKNQKIECLVRGVSVKKHHICVMTVQPATVKINKWIINTFVWNHVGSHHIDIFWKRSRPSVFYWGKTSQILFTRIHWTIHNSRWSVSSIFHPLSSFAKTWRIFMFILLSQTFVYQILWFGFYHSKPEERLEQIPGISKNVFDAWNIPSNNPLSLSPSIFCTMQNYILNSKIRVVCPNPL